LVTGRPPARWVRVRFAEPSVYGDDPAAPGPDDFALRSVLNVKEGVSPQRAALALRGTWADVTDAGLKRIYGDDRWGD
jgi:hypothetical protein